MALIGKIRKHSWIMVVLIGLALLSFLVMDVVTNNSLGGSQTKFSIGKVNGKSIDYNDFSRTEQILYNSSTVDPYVRRNYLWNYLVESSILETQSEKLGFGVSETEMEELQFGNNLSPIIQQRFINPSTGIVDRDQLNQIKQGLDNNSLRPDLVTYWNEQKKEIVKDKLQTKYTSLISKAIYVPAWMAEMKNKESNELIDFQYVKLPFDLVTDSIAITDKEVQQYINDHKANYKYTEEARFLEYVNFNIVPTSQDSAAIYDELNAMVDSFKTALNDSFFIMQNEGTLDPAYFTEAQLSPEHASTIYGLPTGGVVGPYIDGTDYKIAKLVGRKKIADSVTVRHILRSVQTADQLPSAQQTIDSLKKLLEAGTARFDSLAIRFSQDPGSGFNGGDLGTVGHDVMVKPFNDVIFFQATPKNYYTVATQFGIHLIEVTKQSFGKNSPDWVKVAYVRRPIIPSQETQNAIEDEVTTLNNASRNLTDLKKSLASRSDLSFEKTGAVRQNDATAGLLPSSESTRSMVRWAFDKKTNVGDVSPEVYMYEDAVNFYTKQITIAGLKSIQPKGLANVETVRDDINMILSNKKRAQKLISEIGSTADIYALSTKYNTKVDTASSVNFSTSFLPQMGNEPKVIATAFGTEKNATSKPITGNGGVYVVKTVQRVPSIGESDLSFFKEQANAVSKNNVQSFFMESLKKNANIKDNRYTFF
ncbi:MAG: peptidylprolyl isomerase [Saprospiraceae bacterium]|nr:peptidylprolyl isomerase [Saprospiraceae bacterium]